MNESKSPREWLLERHATATPQLETLRREVLAAASISWRAFLGELFRPHRRVWRALAVVWFGLIVLQFTAGRARQARPSDRPPPAAMAAWLNQLKSHGAFAQTDRRP